MNNRIKKYTKELLTEKIQSDNYTDVNKSLFVYFINEIYKNREVAIFTFPFLEKIDEFISSTDNIDMIKKMINTIKNQIDGDFDIVTSGSFGKWIFKLSEEGHLDFDGNIIVFSGSIRKVKEDRFNIVEILKQKYSDISNKKFVFFDDSYISGGTRDRIQEYLDQFNSYICKSFVFYVHTPKDKNEVYYEYCYSDNHIEEIIPIHNYIKHIDNINLYDYKYEIMEKIENGEFDRLSDLLKFIKKIKEDIG